MNIQACPLPRTRELLGALSPPDEGWLAPWAQPGRRTHLFARGAWALAALCDALAARRRRDSATIFVPDYFCNQSLVPIRRRGHRVVFYAITPQLAPDLDSAEALAERFGPADAFLVVHYFGSRTDASASKQFAENHGSVLIEDAAHMLDSATGVGHDGAATLYCPWKLLAAPLGAVAVCVPDLALPAPRISDLRVVPAWLVRRLIQRSLLAVNVQWTGGAGAGAFDADLEPAPMHGERLGGIARRLLAEASRHLERARELRRRHYAELARVVAASRGPGRLLLERLDADACPYVLPLIVEQRYAPHVFRRLNDAGVTAQSWPDLPPEVSLNVALHPAAVELRRRVLTLPVHQDLSDAQMQFIAEMLDTVLRTATIH